MIMRISPGICPRCKKVSLEDIAGKMEVDHLSNCGKHVYYKMYNGVECAICGWHNKTFRIVE